MNAVLSLATPGYPLGSCLRTSGLILWFSLAALPMLTAQESPGKAAPAPVGSPAPAMTASPEEVLASIPAPSGNFLSGKAVSEARSKVRQNPRDAVAWVTLGDELAQVLRDSDDRKYYGYAETAYAYALKLKPQSVDAMDGLAWAAGGRHDFARSVEWAKRALALDATNAAASGLIGDAALALGDYDTATENYQNMMDAKPDLSSWSRGATLLWITGGRSKALWLMERAVKAGAPFAENTAWCRAKYAMMLFDDGALVPATQVLAPALAAGSRNPQILLAAGTIAAAGKDFAAAAQDYRKVLEAGPNPEALASLGDLSTVQGDKEAAEKYYAQAEALYQADAANDPEDPLPAAKFYADHDRNLAEALRLAEKRKETKNVLEADILAWVYFKCGDQPHAIQAMILALSQNSASAEMQFHAGMIAAAADDRPSAQKHLGEALSYNPHFNLLLAPVAAATLAKLGSATPAPSDAKTP